MASFFESTVALSVRRIVYGLLRGVNVFFPRRQNKLIILSYHSIAKDAWRFSVDPEVFRRQIESLLSEYRPCSLSEASEFLSGKRALDTPSFVVTFDDGYRDILEVKDFLAEKNIRPAIFVLSDPERADMDELGTRREFLSVEDILGLHRSGWEVGCHGATHADMWAMTEDQIREETMGAKKKLETELGIPISYFAYPRGRYTNVVKRMVCEAGYECALSMDDGFLSDRTDRFVVPRIGVDRTHSFPEFQSIHTDAAVLFRKCIKKCIGKLL